MSPQFQRDDRKTCKSPCRKKKAGTRPRKRKVQQTETAHKENTNLFPELNFVSSDANTYGLLHSASSKNQPLLRRSMRINRIDSVPSTTPQNDIKDGKLFLFSLGSPKTPNVSGEILVHETPDNQIVGNQLEDLERKSY